MPCYVNEIKFLIHAKYENTVVIEMVGLIKS